MATLTVSNVSKSFNGTTVLQPLDLAVEDGTFCCVLGSSGSGKSTLLRIIAGLESADAGTVTIGDRDVSDTPVERRRVGFMFQNYALFPHLNVLANVMYGLRARRVPRAEAPERAEERLHLIGLRGYEERKLSQLSGGQQQRVALARALVIDPEVLLLDEPLSALDRKIRGEMQRELGRVHDETGLTTVMVKSESVILGNSSATLGRNSLTGTVESVDFTGQFIRATVRVGAVTLPSTMLAHQADGITVGHTVAVSIADGGLHAFAAAP
ncbi:MAG: potA [Frondihabitans sp.]|nr:potA [Frondihabitans sp.]